MRRFQQQGELPAAAATVLGVITDAGHLRKRYESAELDHFSLEVEQDDASAFAVTVSRTARPRGLPSFARKLLGERATLIHHSRWERAGPPFAGEFQLRLEGLPGQVRARLRLEDRGGELTLMAIEGEVEAPVPLLGRRIEALIAERAADSFAASLADIRAQLPTR